MTVGPEDRGIVVRVEGRVQGVGFRWWTQRVATDLGLRGWVRNLADGAVEVHVSGADEALKELQGRLHAGPAGARVDTVSVLGPAEALPETGFQIRLG